MASWRIDSTHQEIPVALTIAGSDCSAGAGVQADCRTLERLGVYAVCAVTSVVAQSPGRVRSVQAVRDDVFRDQLEEIGASFPLSAVKTGMFGTRSILRIAIDWLSEHPGLPLVVDPVLASSAGPSLGGEEVLGLLEEELFPRATLVTPNLPEAEAVLGREIEGESGMIEAAESLFSRFGCAVLLKGGHLEERGEEMLGHLEERGEEMLDVLCIDGGCRVLRSPRLELPDLHGTGCTLSAAIAAGLATGLELEESVQGAREWLRRRMLDHHSWHGARTVHALEAVDGRGIPPGDRSGEKAG